MKISNIIYLSILTLALICAGTDDASAQKRARKKAVTENTQGAKKEKSKIVRISSRVVDENGAPVRNAEIISGEGAMIRYSDADGNFTTQSKSDAVILIEAEGYRDYILDLKAGDVPDEITLITEGFLSGEDDMIERADGEKVTALENTHAVSVIDPEDILKYPDLNLTNAFQGRAAGLIVRSGSGGLGNNKSSFYVRGLHASGTAAIVVVDGMERSIEDIAAEEIGSIQVLKDAPAKALYGPRAANGVVLITTKRGEANKNIKRFTVEYGISPSMRMPDYLGAYDYATLFNEARENDRLSPYYTQQQLQGYLNSGGENDVYYPDNDWYSRFAGSMMSYRKASAEFLGGNRTMQYALIVGYTGGSGVESVGQRTNLNRLNVRGNLDIRINDFISVSADVATRMQFKKFGNLNESDLFSRISTLRPNEYPLTIPAEVLGLEPNKDGTPFFGGSVLNTDNILDDMQYGGHSQNQTMTTSADLGIDLDFDKYVKGLSAEAYFTIDNYSTLNSVMNRFHAAYAIDPYIDADGNQAYRIQQVRKANANNDNININSEQTRRTIGFHANAMYERSFGDHSVSGVLAFRYYMDKAVTKTQDCVTTNTTARFNYAYKSRLFAELVLGMMGSNQFNQAHRYLFTPALSLGYVASMDPYVKIKASAGRLGYDPNSDYLLYCTTWNYPGNYALGEFGDAAMSYRTALTAYGNPDIGWITSTEMNVGAEFSALDNRLSGEVNYFRELREGGIASLSSIYSAVIGQYVMQANCTDVRNHGVDLAIGWDDTALDGDFSYGIGLNFTYSRNKIIRTNEVPGIEEYRKTTGRPTSGIFGLQAEGLFGKEIDLAGHAKQNFGDYTTGDIAYKDQNNDGLIDGRDETYLGQNFPVTVWGLDVRIDYKGFGFYALATAETGASAMMNTSYWWNTGLDSYSVKALDRYHPVNNPEGTLPRLTTTAGSNSYQKSSFWLADADFLRLKNVELSYTWKIRNLNSALRQIKFFVQGTNLLVLSGIKDVDPEMPDAGISTYPAYRTVVGGLSFTF